MSARANCKGSFLLGSACGMCGKCLAELAKLRRKAKPDVTENDLAALEAETVGPQQLEVLRLARIGLWAELHSVEIDDALRIAARGLSSLRRKRIDQAIGSRPKK